MNPLPVDALKFLVFWLPVLQKDKKFILSQRNILCMIKIFRGGRGGEWGGGSTDGCLKWGGGSLRDLSKNILKQRWVKAKVVRRGGGGFEGVTTPSSPENFNHTHCFY